MGLIYLFHFCTGQVLTTDFNRYHGFVIFIISSHGWNHGFRCITITDRTQSCLSIWRLVISIIVTVGSQESAIVLVTKRTKDSWVDEYLWLFATVLVRWFLYSTFLHSLTVDTRKVYGTVVDKEHHLVRKDGGGYTDSDYAANPQDYKATFYEKVFIAIAIPKP